VDAKQTGRFKKDYMQNSENIKFKKKYGQNFISDSNLLSAISRDAGVFNNDIVIEIGPGAGGLTRELLKSAKKVVAYEIDKTLEPTLRENLKEFSNLELIFADILKIDIKEIDKKYNAYKVVANIPYYITTPIIMKFIEEAQNVKSLTLMVQEEVAERLNAKHNTSEYGRITVQVQAQADITVTRKVSRKMFYPVPNVDSAVIRIDINKNKYSIKNKAVFDRVLNASFLNRRKKFSSNLAGAFSIPKEDICKLLEKQNIDILARGETLSPLDFVNLANILYEYV